MFTLLSDCLKICWTAPSIVRACPHPPQWTFSRLASPTSINLDITRPSI